VTDAVYSRPDDMENDSSEARLRREAEFHDEVFVNDARASTDRFYAVASPAYDRYRALVAEQVSGLSVLEYGCGPGSEAFDLARMGARVHGIDISPVAIQLAQKTAAERGVSERCLFEVMNAEALSFADGTFDRICGSGILHHVDLDRAFREIARTLKPGGRGIFVEPLGHNPIINLYRRRTPEMRTDDEHPLLAKDLATASKTFRHVTAEFRHLSVLAAVPLQKTPLFGLARRLLDRVDDLLLAPRSPVRWAAWLVVLILEK
jgi:2-polyprenyl-3-methyl-5-hydroxy-6-metoxy-1,4-benzoquinol methylase